MFSFKKNKEDSKVAELLNRDILIQKIDTNLKKKEKYILVTVLIDNITEIFNIVGQSSIYLVVEAISVYFKKIASDLKFEIYNSNFLNFEMLFEIKHEKEINFFLERFKNYINNTPMLLDSKKIYLNTYLGISVLKSNKNSNEVISESYQALNFAYENSSYYCIFDKKLNTHFSTTFLLSQVESSIKNNDFYLEYQPKLNLQNNKVEEVEALIRWKHPDLGIIPPNEFIPKLEKTNIINKLTNWVISRAMKDIIYLEEQGIKLNISINISPKDLVQRNFIGNLFNKLKKYNLSPERISLEITETDLIKKVDLVIQSLKILKIRGIKIYMDDFGSGYSSLSYINLLPLDYIKIDKSLITNIFKDKKKKALIKSTIEMLHILKKVVVVEGIEDLRTLNYLKKLNCELVQGFYISKPLSRKNLITFINKENDFLEDISFEKYKVDKLKMKSI